MVYTTGSTDTEEETEMKNNRKSAKKFPHGTSSTAPGTSQRGKDSAAPSPQITKMQAAVADAFQASRRASTSKDVDEYGKGLPTDRLQFGYAPSVTEEAVCFHSQIPASVWIADRRRLAKNIYGKRQRGSADCDHCERLTSVLKLRDYWKTQSETQGVLHRQGKTDLKSLDDLLEVLASKQRV